jgi:hypothetical protein
VKIILLSVLLLNFIFAKDISITGTGQNELEARKSALRELSSQIEVSLETSLSRTTSVTNGAYNNDIVSKSDQKSKVKFLGLKWDKFDEETKSIKVTLKEDTKYLYKNRLQKILDEISYYQKAIYVLETDSAKLDYYKKIKELINEFILVQKVAIYFKLDNLPKPQIPLKMIEAHVMVKIDKLSINKKNNNKDTFTDSYTKLVWQKDVSVTKYNFENAIKYCKNLSLDDISDFRLPSIDELESIKKSTANHINKDIEQIFWSSTKKSEKSRYIKVYNFSKDVIKNTTATKRFYVRCVK